MRIKFKFGTLSLDLNDETKLLKESFKSALINEITSVINQEGKRISKDLKKKNDEQIKSRIKEFVNSEDFDLRSLSEMLSGYGSSGMYIGIIPKFGADCGKVVSVIQYPNIELVKGKTIYVKLPQELFIDDRYLSFIYNSPVTIVESYYNYYIISDNKDKIRNFGNGTTK